MESVSTLVEHPDSEISPKGAEQQEEQDTEIQDVSAEIKDTLQLAFDLLVERRDTAWAAATAALDSEQEALTAEHAGIEGAAHSLEAVLPAKARQAQRESDELLLAGKREESAAKMAEMREAEAAPRLMRERQAEIDRRIEAIGGEKRSAAMRVFEAWYSECQTVIRAAEHGLFVVLLDGLRDSFFRFQTATDTAEKKVGGRGLFTYGHITDLTSPAKSNEWASSQQWYAGRGIQR